jgi:hypothetical protein
MKLLLLLLSGLNVGAVAKSPDTTGLCPADDIYLRGSVADLVSNSRVRSNLGMTAVDPSHLRPLSDAGDGTACQKLQTLAVAGPEGVSSVIWSYYTADGFYFAAVRSAAVGGYGAIYIFDSEWSRKEVVLL